jgi:hypothetical protein
MFFITNRLVAALYAGRIRRRVSTLEGDSVGHCEKKNSLVLVFNFEWLESAKTTTM